jgi:hypothetical protein
MIHRDRSRTSEYARFPADDIRSGNPDRYFDYIERIYGDGFRAGTTDALETFYQLYQQISQLGNEQSKELFLARFLPLLSRDARRKIINDIMPGHRPKAPSDMN